LKRVKSKFLLTLVSCCVISADLNAGQLTSFHISKKIPQINQEDVSSEALIAKNLDTNFLRVHSKGSARSTPVFDYSFILASIWDEASIPGRLSNEGLNLMVKKSLDEMKKYTDEDLYRIFNFGDKDLRKFHQTLEIIEGYNAYIDSKTIARAFSLAYLNHASKDSTPSSPNVINNAHQQRSRLSEPEEIITRTCKGIDFLNYGSIESYQQETGKKSFEAVRTKQDGFFNWLPEHKREKLLSFLSNTFQYELIGMQRPPLSHPPEIPLTLPKEDEDMKNHCLLPNNDSTPPSIPTHTTVVLSK
jgi:hypothetical protein